MSEEPNKNIDENDLLRYKRLIFYSEDIEKMNEYLSDFLDSSQAKAALVIDVEGHLVTKMGYTKSLDTESLSALIAGSFASTRQVANILGEEEFTEIYHQGKNDNIYISLINDRALAVFVFDSRTTVGMVKFYSQELSENIAVLMKEKAEKMEEQGESEEEGFLEDDFSDSMKNRLDDLFDL